MEINDTYLFLLKACSRLHLPQSRSHASTCFIISVINSFIQVFFSFPVVKKVIQLSGEPSARMQFSSSDIPNAIKKNEIRHTIIRNKVNLKLRHLRTLLWTLIYLRHFLLPHPVVQEGTFPSDSESEDKIRCWETNMKRLPFSAEQKFMKLKVITYLDCGVCCWIWKMTDIKQKTYFSFIWFLVINLDVIFCYNMSNIFCYTRFSMNFMYDLYSLTWSLNL